MSEQEILDKCKESFSNIFKEDEYSLLDLHSSLIGHSRNKLQNELLKDFGYYEPATLPKLAAIASECRQLHKNAPARRAEEEVIAKIVSTAEDKLAEAILKGGKESWVPILKIEGKPSMKEGSLPQWLPPPLTPREAAVQSLLSKLPGIETAIREDNTFTHQFSSSYDISIRLKSPK